MDRNEKFAQVIQSVGKVGRIPEGYSSPVLEAFVKIKLPRKSEELKKVMAAFETKYWTDKVSGYYYDYFVKVIAYNMELIE